jgi:nitrogen fixation NifU-like protein
MATFDPTPGAAVRYAATTVDHFQHPRNVGRLAAPDGVGTLDDPERETTITLYLRVADGRVGETRFRTFGCSACVAASSMATVLLVGRPAEPAAAPTADELDAALERLPPEKRYCAELVAEAASRALASLRSTAAG